MDIIIFIPFFILLWILSTAMISLLGGWYSLAQKYKPMDQGNLTFLDEHKFQSMQIGFFTRYRSSIHVKVFKEGVLFQPVKLLAFMHKPIYVSRESLILVKAYKFPKRLASFQIGSKKVRIYGKVINYLREIDWIKEIS